MENFCDFQKLYMTDNQYSLRKFWKTLFYGKFSMFAKMEKNSIPKIFLDDVFLPYFYSQNTTSNQYAKSPDFIFLTR